MNKIFYVNRNEFENRNAFTIHCDESVKYNTKVEIKIIEPVYEYQVVFKHIDRYAITSKFYENKNEFVLVSTHDYKFIELYQPSKRERVQ